MRICFFIVSVICEKDNPYAGNKRESQDDNNYILRPNTDCTAFHTIKLPSGLCACEEGYPYGDPNNERGCFNCTNMCHPMAFCAYPGRCRCKSGYKGNGINYCSAPVPYLRNFQPDSWSEKGNKKLIALYSVDEQFGIETVFCRFGNRTTLGKFESEGRIICIIPPSYPHTCEFSISFDNTSWSQEYAEFVYVPLERSYATIVFSFLALAFLVGAIFIFQGQIKLNHIENEEAEPFQLKKAEEEGEIVI